MVNALDQVPEVPKGPNDQKNSLAGLKDSMDETEEGKGLKKLAESQEVKAITEDVTKGKLHLMEDVVKKFVKGDVKEGTQSVPAEAFTAEAGTSVVEPQREEGQEKKPGNELWRWLKKAFGIKNDAPVIDAGKKQAKPEPIEEADAFEAKEEVVDGKKPTNEDKDEKVMAADEATPVETPLLNPIAAASDEQESRPEPSKNMAA